MNKEFESLKNELAENLKRELGEQDAVLALLAKTLKSFSYRYLETKFSGEGVIEKSSDHSFKVSCEEDSLKEALKNSSGRVKDEIINLAKRVSYKDKPRVQMSLEAGIKNYDPAGRGTFFAVSSINWDFPDFKNKKENFEQKEVSFKFSDVVEFRNNFPKYLEEACALFISANND